MKAHVYSTLEDLKGYRRTFADVLSRDLDPETARRLGETHLAVLAIEAVLAEPEPIKTGRHIEFGEDGYPK